MKTKSLLTFGVVAIISVLVYKYFKKNKSNDYSNASGDLTNVKNLPSNFVRKGGFPTGCARYEKFITPEGTMYQKRHYIKSNPPQISNVAIPIEINEFVNAYKSKAFC